MNPHSYSYLFRRGEDRTEKEWWCDTCEEYISFQDTVWHVQKGHEISEDRYNPDEDYNHDIDDRVT